jgi:predicted O-methyltransferase YrrM
MITPSALLRKTILAAFSRLAASEKHLDEVARVLARIAPLYLREERFPHYFPFWEAHGFHLTPVHFYQPIPDTRTLTDDLWAQDSALVGIDLNDAVQLDLLRSVFPRFRAEYDQLPTQPTDLPYEFYMDNGMFEGVDALVLYCLIRHFQPGLILEVGSGFSSRLSAQAALRTGSTRLVCIDPNPAAIITRGFPGLSSLIAEPVQKVGLEFFEQLEAGDFLFIDSSHVVKCGGDVNYLFLEVLPRLRQGVIVHVHDIFLPQEFPRSWMLDFNFFFTEQYLLQAFLTYNSEFEILFASAYVERKYSQDVQAAFPKARTLGDASFWMRRKPE